MMTIQPELQERLRKLEFERMLKAALMEHLKVSVDVDVTRGYDYELGGATEICDIQVVTVIWWDDDAISSSTSKGRLSHPR